MSSFSPASPLRRAAAICLLTATLWGPAAARSDGAVPACVLEASEVARDGRLAAGSADTWRWRSAPGDVVRCDLDAYEPLDAACPEAPCPGETTLRLRPGRALELVDSGAPGAVEVEWRRFGEPGAASELVARRRLATPAAPGPRVLYSAAAEDRLLRLRADGGAPETFFVPAALSEGVEADGAALPLAPAWPGAGGELFGFIEAGGSWPTALRLSDAKTVHELTIDEWGQFGASGLPPGRYQLRATFRGGWRTEGPTIRVEEGETVELLPWGLSPSGGVDLDLGPGLCAEATAAGTLRVRFGHRRERDRVLELDPEVCRHRVEGLAPGQWRLVLDRAAESDTAMRRRSDRPSSTASVEIVAGEIAWATLTKPAVRVTGRVTAGGEGLPGVGVRVAPAPRDGASPAATPTSRDDFGGWTGSAETEADGVFTLEARAPGPAVLHLFSEDGFPVVSRDVELVVGTVRQDFDLGDGRIRVSVSSAEGRPAGPVTLEAWDVAGHRLVRTGSLEADQESTLIFGLEFGRYELNAFTEGGLATLERPQVELSKLRPDGEAELVLEKQRAVATVLDANGLAVSGLLFAIDQRQLAETGDRPGEYSLLGASAGSELLVVPPLSHVPVCRRLERIESLEITLRTADAHALLVPPDGPLPPAGAFLGALENLPGSNCAMPVSLNWRPVEDAAGRGLVRIDGLTRGTFLFRNNDGVVIVQIPGPPVPMPGVE